MCIEFDAKSKNNCQKNFCHRIQIDFLKKDKNIEKILHLENILILIAYSILHHN